MINPVLSDDVVDALLRDVRAIFQPDLQMFVTLRIVLRLSQLAFDRLVELSFV